MDGKSIGGVFIQKTIPVSFEIKVLVETHLLAVRDTLIARVAVSSRRLFGGGL